MPIRGSVYANSSDALYRIDRDPLTVTRIGTFTDWSGTPMPMTNIGLDRNGNMTGVGYTWASINTETAALKGLTVNHQIADSPPDPRPFINALSYAPRDLLPPTTAGGPDILIAVTVSGDVWAIDPAQPRDAYARLGSYGGNIQSSGDIVAIEGVGAFATVKVPESPTDYLARVDLKNGAATLIGDTHVQDIWGLGYWDGDLFGFTQGGEILILDQSTAAARVVNRNGPSWWGAAVTTTAPTYVGD